MAASSADARPAPPRPAVVLAIRSGERSVHPPLRDRVARLVPVARGTFPWATFGTNVSGAFVLGSS